MTVKLMLVVMTICILSVFANGILLALAAKKNEEMINLYRGMLNLVKHSKVFSRRRK